MTNLIPAAVNEVFLSYPEEARKQLLAIRALVFKIAVERTEVGPITETLKWGEPSYLTEKSKSGSTIRLAWRTKNPQKVGVFLNCNTSLVESYRELQPDALTYVGNREIALSIDEPFPEEALTLCISMALTYHLDKRPK
jgi:hypothetical protein